MAIVTATGRDDLRQAPALRRYVLCPPTHFDVVYRINPWMDPTRPTDTGRALAQWEAVRGALEAAGHNLAVCAPAPGLPDMVFAANAGLVAGDRVLLSRFRHPERRGEERRFAAWFAGLGFEVSRAVSYNEGEGDYAFVGDLVLGGSGFRTDPASHRQVAEFFARPVHALELVDERFYHLDTALAVLGPDLVAYWPGAFSMASRGLLGELFPEAVVATEADAVAFGLNACCDGSRVFLAAGAPRLSAQLAERGFLPVPLDTSELQRSGGSVKCCILEVH